MNEEEIVLTPMMKQFLDLKAKHPDAVMLFRCGDFYETYSTDAIVAAEILGITLTKRANGKGKTIEMAGFPHHALDTYLPKLVRAGKRVAICDQLEDPKMTKKLVKRGITELVTPGVSINDNVLNYKENNFLAAVHFGKASCGVAFLDISTGEFLTAEGPFDYIDKLLNNFAPKEILFERGKRLMFEGNFGNKFFTFELDDWVFTETTAREKLLKHFETKNLKGFGVELKVIAFGSIFTILLILLFFFFDVMHGNVLHSIVAILLVAGIAFLFTTVAANAIAIVGTNPVSGMTLMTLILASVVMVAVGLKGATGMVAALVMGGVVCTALSMAGGFITDLKIGYWLGSTPAKQETWKFLGTLVSAATVGGVIMILNKTYGFSTGALAAPQANAMAAVIDPLMNGVGAPWLLYGIGAVLALVLTYFKVPALAFALGMFIPLELNLPLLVGGAVNWYVTTRSKDEAVNAERGEKGTLLASGFIAGGALMGVVSAAMRFGGINLVNEEWLSNPLSEVLSIVAYILLIIWLVKASMHIKKK